jgi:hypothetical protein
MFVLLGTVLDPDDHVFNTCLTRIPMFANRFVAVPRVSRSSLHMQYPHRISGPYTKYSAVVPNDLRTRLSTRV